MPNLKRQGYEEDPSQEENKARSHMQMCNTGYEGFGGGMKNNYY